MSYKYDFKSGMFSRLANNLAGNIGVFGNFELAPAYVEGINNSFINIPKFDINCSGISCFIGAKAYEYSYTNDYFLKQGQMALDLNFNNLYSPLNMFSNVRPASFGMAIYSTPSVQLTSAEPSNTSDLSSLRGKHWSEMSDAQLRQVYGNHTRNITSLYKGTAEDLNKYLRGKGVLEGKGQAFIDAQNRYGISAAVLVAITMLESGGGTSNYARNKNNVGGVRISGSAEFRSFESVEACIMEMGRFLNAGYVNNSGRPLTQLYQVNAKYCPTSDPTGDPEDHGRWASAVDRFASQVESALA